MVSYALDQKVRIDRAETSDSTLKSGSIERGVFRTTSIEQREITYKIAGPARETRKLILEIPKLAGYTLVEPKEGVEESDLYWRIPAKVAAGKTVEVKVIAQRPSVESVAVDDMGDGQIAYYAVNNALDAKTRAAFAKIAELKRTMEEHETLSESLAAKLEALTEEQSRLRANLDAVPRDSDLYRRYLKKLDDQETAIEGLQTKIADADEAAEAVRKKLEDYLASL
ncbi:hypothetical protein D3874_21615 [Oleomonas cavernae]|uniref:Uncharacterized protein n=1 Tax=Oleomonas cavernae TaxID=2320859 RepID=A0A418WGU2_9PROT|nr:hypothetical protein [Oleomonas cavernae]RJF89247.1 hypothetical protein D3874_21615 [Oleomonas cavernae]